MKYSTTRDFALSSPGGSSCGSVSQPLTYIWLQEESSLTADSVQVTTGVNRMELWGLGCLLPAPPEFCHWLSRFSGQHGRTWQKDPVQAAPASPVSATSSSMPPSTSPLLRAPFQPYLFVQTLVKRWGTPLSALWCFCHLCTLTQVSLINVAVVTPLYLYPWEPCPKPWGMPQTPNSSNHIFSTHTERTSFPLA